MIGGDKLKPKTKCTGGDKCPLGIPHHPQASFDGEKAAFAIGCGLCRSEKIAMLGDRAGAGTGANVEKRSFMKIYDGVLGHDIARELVIVRAGEPAPVEVKNEVPFSRSEARHQY